MLQMLSLTGSSFAPAISETAAIYHKSPVVTTLGTTIMMIGYGIGPLLWAPVCEIRGRILATIIPYAAGAIFAFGTGASQSLASIFINRCFTGFFCSPPVSNVGGVPADIWPDEQRGAAMAICGLIVASGPLLGDIVGGAVVNYSLSWRWTQYISGILMSTAFAFGTYVRSRERCEPPLGLQGSTAARRKGKLDPPRRGRGEGRFRRCTCSQVLARVRKTAL